MSSVDQPDAELAFQYVVNRLPVHTNAFERDIGTAPFGQPGSDYFQITSHGGETAGLTLKATIGKQTPPTGDQELLVDVQTSATRNENIHEDASGTVASHMRVVSLIQRV